MNNLLHCTSKSWYSAEFSWNLCRGGAVDGRLRSLDTLISPAARIYAYRHVIAETKLRFCITCKLDARGKYNDYSPSSSVGLFHHTNFNDKLGEQKSFRIDAKKQKRSWWKKILFENITLDDFPSNESYANFEEADTGAEPVDEGQNSTDETVASDDNKTDKFDGMIASDDKFSVWKQKLDAISNRRKYEERGGDDADDKEWEDWLDESWSKKSEVRAGAEGWYEGKSEWEGKDGLPRNAPKVPERGMNMTVKELFFRFFRDQEEVEENLKFEERVFNFTSRSTAKFATCLLLIPWFVGYIVHDYAVVPFLNRYVQKVPLAAKLLDVRESQKLKMIETLKLERQRVRLESAIGKAPPLSDVELIDHLKDKAHELQEEVRAENRNAFANLWSDLVVGIAVLLLLLFNPNQVAIMKLTGNRLFASISDSGKAFIIILLSDIFLGYHSESGWETVIEIFLEHYGFEVGQASIYVFVAIVPVTIDACFKLWVFRYLTRFSSSAAATFRAMKRH